VVRATDSIFSIAIGFACCALVLSGSEGAVGAQEAFLRVAGFPSDPEDIVWENLPLLDSTRVEVFKGEENLSAFNHHPTIAWHDGIFFAAWSNGDRDEDASGQRVLYATSEDGRVWTEPRKLAEGIPGRAYTPCGFWIREGEVFALAALRNSRDGAPGADDNPLIAYRWSKKDSVFEYDRVMAGDFFAVDAPRMSPDGQWLMIGKSGGGDASSRARKRVAKGGVRSVDDWSFGPLSTPVVAHDTFWYLLPKGQLLAIEAKGRVLDRRLVRIDSVDGGDSWLEPVGTNFPDADSRLCGLRLSTGRYVLLNNPNPARYRVPLSLAVSKNGLVYDRMANVRVEQTNKRYSGHAKAPGYQYVRAVEQGGRLWVIYSVNKEDVEISVVSLEEIERLYASEQVYPQREPGLEIVIDNSDEGFETDRVWPTESVAAGQYGPDYAFLPPAAATGEVTGGWATWTTEIRSSGMYRIYLRWATIGFSQRSPMEHIVPVEIRHPGGTDRTTVDHTRYGGDWIFLGAYQLNAGENVEVKILAEGNGITVADAVKFVKTVEASGAKDARSFTY
jgi:hypothetical protein